MSVAAAAVGMCGDEEELLSQRLEVVDAKRNASVTEQDWLPNFSLISMLGWGKDKKKDKSPWSSKDYIAKELKKKDAENFAAAGILVFNSNGPASLEMLLGRNCTKNELEFLGGKRDDREDVFTTAAREFDEETGGILGDIKKDLPHPFGQSMQGQGIFGSVVFKRSVRVVPCSRRQASQLGCV